MVTYGEGESKYKYKKIPLPKAAFECSTPSVESPDLSEKESSRSLIQEHFEEISNKLTSVHICRTSKKLITGSSSSTLQNTVPQYKGKTDNFSKIGEKRIIIIEDMDIENEPEVAATKYLTNNLHPSTQPKYREWYEAILQDTHSVFIKHTMRNKKDIAYSSLTIRAILSYKDWEQHPLQRKIFKDKNISPRTYNYFDYIDAWENVLYYQSPQKSHSWFITIRAGEDFKDNGIPNWFKNWFGYFGLKTGILSNKARGGFRYFEIMNALKITDQSEALLYFTALYEVPWIFRWEDTIFKSTELGFPQLGKTFFGQWWKKFNDSHLSETKLKLVLIGQDEPEKQETSEVSKLISSLGKRKLQPQDKEILKQMLEETDENNEEDVEMVSDSDEDYIPCLAGYSQDPNKF